MKPPVRTDREDAISVSRIKMPASASTTPITSRRRSGDRRSHSDGSGRAGGRAAELFALADFLALVDLLPLRLLFADANGLISGMGIDNC